MAKIEEIVYDLAKPIVEENGLVLIDTEYKKEGPDWYLRIYIDKEDGVGIDDCQLVNDAMDEILDREDIIDQHYIFEVSSPGLTRKLRNPFEYEWYSGEKVEVKLYKAIDGKKSFIGILQGLKDGFVEIEDEDSNELISFDIKDVNFVKRIFEF